MGLFVNQHLIRDDLQFEPSLKLNRFWSWERNNLLKIVNNNFDPDTLSLNNAFGDAPIPLFYKYLDKKYPGSKFIYCYRDEEKWLDSMKWMYEEGAVLWRHGLLEDEIKYATYGTTVFDRNTLLRKYRNYHQEVLDYFVMKKNDLLVLNMDKNELSYAILCKYLDKPLPDSSFPQSNKNRSVSRIAKTEYSVGRRLPLYSYIKRKLSHWWHK